MRKVQKQRLESVLGLMKRAHGYIIRLTEAGDIPKAMTLLEACQNGAIAVGTTIENTECDGHPTIPLLEEYCEIVYQLGRNLENSNKLRLNQFDKLLHRKLIKVENSIKNDISTRLEVAFFPYKASMWDSLESIWKAAYEDPDCDAYVIPVPYYDRNPDGTFGTYHYEGGALPDHVPVTHYETYRIEERRPDIAYIHNPYDQTNYVTSVEPQFYSFELKKYVGCLVYVPYYATAGNMAEGQVMCPAYYYADYIIIQAEKYRRFFDPALPDRKFVSLGSPKFDKIIHACRLPSEPLSEWKEKLAGKRGYFYNTSIHGMLADTEKFLAKMEYVFRCFEGRENVCLIWRPHPLLESTFHSMRPIYWPQYELLKNRFIDQKIGIYDDTQNVENTIALSDVYIGDSGTSITSLFGVVGKPLFIFDNNINTFPEKDDWRGEKINLSFDECGDDRYQITRNNQLWFSENNDYHYKFYMDLETGYSGGNYYKRAVEIKNKIYVLPANAQHLLIIDGKKIRKVCFKEPIVRQGAFVHYWYNEKYIFLFPYKYPYIIRWNIDTEEICYVDAHNQFRVGIVGGEEYTGGVKAYGNELAFASPVNNRFLFMDIDTLKTRWLSSNSDSNLGTLWMEIEEDNLWLLPFNGMTLTCWNPKTGYVREYSDVPKGFKCIKWPYDYECREIPFGTIAFSKEGDQEKIILSPYRGNMYVSLDRETGEMKEWIPPMEHPIRGKNGYFVADRMGDFLVRCSDVGKADCRIWCVPERKLYDINIDTKEYREVEIEFDYEELKEHESGFMEESEWMQYCLRENAFNSLKAFLDGNITGCPFDRNKQIQAFTKINADMEGTCGKNVHHFVKGKIT